ncbi:DUF2087 domain-containing protein [Luteococcus peritonei]|uniref:DUF2087 domain-containing protein n=1 Tax=Luteococcus peritonei TaxID=88874 RepID=A0ABW4RS10_9ACTN
MTRDKDFKALVRSRMRETGQTYTAARAHLADEQEAGGRGGPGGSGATPAPSAQPVLQESERWRLAREEQERVVGRFVGDGRLVNFPARRRARAHVLLHLAARFERGRIWSEPEVNQRLAEVVEDHAFWRRELVDYGYLEREAGRYWLARRLPVRPAHMAQEIPDWEALWLPGHLGLGDPA